MAAKQQCGSRAQAIGLRHAITSAGVSLPSQQSSCSSWSSHLTRKAMRILVPDSYNLSIQAGTSLI